MGVACTWTPRDVSLACFPPAQKAGHRLSDWKGGIAGFLRVFVSLPVLSASSPRNSAVLWKDALEGHFGPSCAYLSTWSWPYFPCLSIRNGNSHWTASIWGQNETKSTVSITHTCWMCSQWQWLCLGPQILFPGPQLTQMDSLSFFIYFPASATPSFLLQVHVSTKLFRTWSFFFWQWSRSIQIKNIILWVFFPIIWYSFLSDPI